MRDRMTRRQVDIAATPDDVEAHDIVVLHRVVCCHPEYERLLTAAADHAKRLLVFSHPPCNWVTRTFTRLQRVGFRLMGKVFPDVRASPGGPDRRSGGTRHAHRLHPPRSALADRRPRAIGYSQSIKLEKPLLRRPAMTNEEVTDRLRSLWERYAPRYDRDTGFYDLLLLGNSRSWACSQASSQVLEVAIGTGRNLPFYPRGIQLTAIDFSPAMLDIARGRAAKLGIDVTLIEADAQHLPFAADRFDTVVCTLALSSIPDPAAAINEMHRVLRPGGQLLVVGHVASPYRVVRAG
jgi:2-polyprenyl-3-methyl-5-hydroxy-6-metoxy-1,4-benzoquinol methylase